MVLRPTFTRIIAHLADKRPPGWTTIGLHLLSCADPSEQTIVERKFVELRGIVRRSFRDPKHLSSLQIQPPEDRKARVVFFLFPEAQRATMSKDMEQLAAEVVEEGKLESCVVFSRSVDQWDRPYEAVLMVHADRTKI